MSDSVAAKSEMPVAERNAIERIGDRVATGVERLLALGLIAAIVLDFVNVMGRYTGGFSLLGVDEIEIDILVWIAFLGAVAITWRRQHLRMDVLYHGCPSIMRRAITIFESAVMLVVTSFVAIESYAYVSKLYVLGVVSDIVGAPIWISNLAVTICFAAMAVIFAWRGVRLVGGRHGDAEEGGP